METKDKMTKSNSEEKMLKLRNEAVKLINNITSTSKDNRIHEFPQKCNNLTKHLFAHPYLLHSDLNEYFESSSILSILLGALHKLQEPFKRDVLRLIYMLLQAKRSLRDEARKSEFFQEFVQKNLESAECFENLNKFKHHLNIASQLLADRDAASCSFDNELVRKVARKTLDDIVAKNYERNEESMSCIIFYACLMLSGGFDNCRKNVENKNSEDEMIAEKIFIKDVIGSITDKLRDYIHDFKLFYTDEIEPRKSQYVLYKPKPGYSFQQMCCAITYYSIQNETVRKNLFQNGFYILMNNFFSLKFVPESIFLYGMDILKLPFLDDAILQKVKNEFLKPFNEKLNTFLRNDAFTANTKAAILDLLKSFEAPDIDSFDIPSGDVINRSLNNDDALLIQVTNINNNQNPNEIFGFEKWGHLDVDEWLANNNLEELRGIFTNLTGRGLKQLQSLLKEKNKIVMIDFLMAKIGINFQMTLELIGALETL